MQNDSVIRHKLIKKTWFKGALCIYANPNHPESLTNQKELIYLERWLHIGNQFKHTMIVSYLKQTLLKVEL